MLIYNAIFSSYDGARGPSVKELLTNIEIIF